MTSLVLSSAPLSEEYRHRLVGMLGKHLVFAHLAEVRRQPPLATLRHLRAAAAEGCYIAIEDDSSRAVLPILQAIGSATWPRRLQLIHEDLSTSGVSSARFPLAVAATLSATVTGSIAARRASAELKQLRSAARVELATPSPRRLLYINANLWFGLKAGGSVGHVAGVVNAFSRRGLDVSLATSPDPVMIAPSVHVKRLAPPASLGLPFELNYYSFQRYVVQVLARESTDLCYQRLSIGSYAGVVLSRRLSVPLVIEWNGSEAWIARNWGRRLRYEELALAAEDVSLKHAHIVVTVSVALRDELVERGVEPDRIVCHPNGVDPAIFDPERFSPAACAALRIDHNIPEHSIVVTFLGTFGRWHGAHVLARAIRKLGDTRADWLAKMGVRFLFVGEGPKLADVKDAIRASPAAPFVCFTGLVPQAMAPAYLAASDIVVAPHVPNADGSPFFGSPTKLFEYMAMGCAIVASDLDQLGDVLCDGIDVHRLTGRSLGDDSSATAILVPPGDADALATGIEFLVDRPAWRGILGRNARQLALRRYTWDHHVAAILERMELIGSTPRAT
jgi:glycosyltransferase involved in cell wall biosynthesis